jgi:phosphate transport system substrate-binding protein
VKTFVACAVPLFCAMVALADTPVPATVEFMFDPAAPQGIKTVITGDAGYLKEIRQSAGTITNGWWHVASATSFGQGNLQFHLDRTKLAGDLALVLHADWQKDTDIAVQLYDAQGRALALDLFGEMRRNAQTAGTDTFVVPLNHYPEAVSIMVRRLSGDVRLLGGGLYPVVSELSSTAENEKALAQQLGVIISPHHWMLSGGGGKESAGSQAYDDGVGKVHKALPSIGALALKQAGYPPYRPITSGALIPPKMQASNTTEAIINNAMRMIALRSGDKLKPVGGPSSAGMAHMLLNENYDLGFMSIALSSAEKEKFFRKSGYSMVELRFCRDALQMVVHPSNQVTSLTIPQLDAIYGTELRAGATAPLSDWSQLGQAAGPIRIVGGDPSYGTSRVFQQMVLKGGEFKSNLVKTCVECAETDGGGVLKTVADNPDAIGFATFRPRALKVRAIAVAANSGEQAYFPSPDAIYDDRYPLQRKFYGYVAVPSFDQAGPFTREFVNLLLSDVGQTLVAREGSLPLSANEVVAERAKLGLPQ